MLCPLCKTEMKDNYLIGNEVFTDGLPKERISEVTFKGSLHYYSCLRCQTANDTHFCDFLIFKDGQNYGYNGGKWVLIVKPKQVFVFR